MTGLDCQLQCALGSHNLSVSLRVEPGVTVLLGPNGSGKSSFLRLIAGLSRPESGHIRLGEHLLYHSQQRLNLPPEQRQIGILFQDLALFPHLNVKQNIAFGLRMRRISREETERKITAILDKLGIASLAQRSVVHLSGGEKQKVALGRTLITDPQLLLLDEPTAALDPSARGTIRRWLRDILIDLRIPTLLVTHDTEEVAWFRKRVAVIEKGKIVQQGSYHQLLREPQSDFVARFAGINLISGKMYQDQHETFFVSDGGTKLQGRFGNVLPGPATLAIAPWEVALFREPPGGSPQNIVPGRISEKIILGDRVRITLLGAEKLVAEISHKAWKTMGEFEEGTQLYAVFKAREARIISS